MGEEGGGDLKAPFTLTVQKAQRAQPRSPVYLIAFVVFLWAVVFFAFSNGSMDSTGEHRSCAHRVARGILATRFLFCHILKGQMM